MKEIKCKQCGEIIQAGWNINPSNSDVCEDCILEELKEQDKIWK